MDEAALTRYITDTFAGLETASAEGVTVFSYNPDHKPSAGVYFATLKGRDDDHDDHHLDEGKAPRRTAS